MNQDLREPPVWGCCVLTARLLLKGDGQYWVACWRLQQVLYGGSWSADPHRNGSQISPSLPQHGCGPSTEHTPHAGSSMHHTLHPQKKKQAWGKEKESKTIYIARPSHSWAQLAIKCILLTVPCLSEATGRRWAGRGSFHRCLQL